MGLLAMKGWPRLGQVGLPEAKRRRRGPGRQGLPEPEAAGTASRRGLGWNGGAARRGRQRRVTKEWTDMRGRRSSAPSGAAAQAGSSGRRGEASCSTRAIYEYVSLKPEVISKAA